jgi:hypothetical protein
VNDLVSHLISVLKLLGYKVCDSFLEVIELGFSVDENVFVVDVLGLDAFLDCLYLAEHAF